MAEGWNENYQNSSEMEDDYYPQDESFDDIDDGEDYLNVEEIQADRQSAIQRSSCEVYANQQELAEERNSFRSQPNLSNFPDDFTNLQIVGRKNPPPANRRKKESQLYIEVVSDNRNSQSSSDAPCTACRPDKHRNRKVLSDIEGRGSFGKEFERKLGPSQPKQSTTLPFGLSPPNQHQHKKSPAKKSPAINQHGHGSNDQWNIDRPPSQLAPPPPGHKLTVMDSGRETGSSSGLHMRNSNVNGKGAQQAKPCSKLTNKQKRENLSQFSWYKEWMSREEAIKKVKEYKVDGSFVVRKSRTAGLDKPYTITILCRGEVFHLPIRIRSEDSLYAIGNQKEEERVFATIEDLIRHFNLNLIDLVSSDPKRQREEFKVFLKYHN